MKVNLIKTFIARILRDATLRVTPQDERFLANKGRRLKCLVAQTLKALLTIQSVFPEDSDQRSKSKDRRLEGCDWLRVLRSNPLTLRSLGVALRGRASRRALSAIALVLLFPVQASAFAPVNFFQPYDLNYRFHYPDQDDNVSFRIGVNGEFGSTGQARNWKGKTRNVLQMYDETQNAIAMLLNPTKCISDRTGNLLQCLVGACVGHPTDDCQRGHMRFTGAFDGWELTPHIRFLLPFDVLGGDVGVSAHLPVRYAKIDGISKCDLTGDCRSVDLEVKRLLTDQICQKAKEFGCLDLSSWSETGLGDLVLLLDWMRPFPQTKENLKEVTVHAKVGLSIPTGKEKDEDKAFSMALGRGDGAWGIPFGLGLDLYFKQRIMLGGEAEFMVLFDKTRVRRLKTHEFQTEFLLLNKGEATKDHGLQWKFNLYLQAYQFWKGLSAKFTYQYSKHDDDRLIPLSDVFSSLIVNTAHSLQEDNMHHFIFQMSYDFFEECENFWVKPQVNLFYKVPLTGRGTIDPHTFGGQIGFNF